MSLFTYGENVVQYTATDKNGNPPTICRFSVNRAWSNCSEPDSPPNTRITCVANSAFDKYCYVDCIDSVRYSFPLGATVPPVYVCDGTGTWSPAFDIVPECTPSTAPTTTYQDSQSVTVDNCEASRQRVIEAYYQKLVQANGLNSAVCNGNCERLKPFIQVTCPPAATTTAAPSSGRRRRATGETLKIVLNLPNTESGTSTAFCDAIKRGLPTDTTQPGLTVSCPTVVPTCPNGYILDSATCVQCQRGTYHDNSKNTCELCAKDTYQDETGKTQCKSCPANVPLTLGMGAVSTEYCYQQCPAGQYYSDANKCEQCPSGSVAKTTGTLQCLPCGAGEYSPHGKKCMKCPSGNQIVADGTCKVCPIGTYRDEATSTTCQSCPDSKTTKQAGAMSVSSCTTSICSAGSYLNPTTNQCTLCTTGTYQPEANQRQCVCCPERTTTTITGATSVSQCKEGSVSKCQTCVPCHSKATCTDTSNMWYSCKCNGPNWVGNGTSCQCAPGRSGMDCETDNTEAKNNSVIIAAVVGTICGALALIAVVALIVFLIRRFSSSPVPVETRYFITHSKENIEMQDNELYRSGEF